MNLREYFEGVKGQGVLATADSEGQVGVAIYAKPHIMDDDMIAFIMSERLTHHNLQSNSHAAYLFKEESPGYKGIRLFLTKVREEKDSELLYSIRRRSYPNEQGQEASRYLVFFKVDKVLPLIGTGKGP